MAQGSLQQYESDNCAEYCEKASSVNLSVMKRNSVAAKIETRCLRYTTFARDDPFHMSRTNLWSLAVSTNDSQFSSLGFHTIRCTHMIHSCFINGTLIYVSLCLRDEEGKWFDEITNQEHRLRSVQFSGRECEKDPGLEL